MDKEANPKTKVGWKPFARQQPTVNQLFNEAMKHGPTFWRFIVWRVVEAGVLIALILLLQHTILEQIATFGGLWAMLKRFVLGL